MIVLNMIIILFVRELSSLEDSSRSIGYATGYLSDCPGSTKEARISPKSLSRLELLLFHDNNVFNSLTNNTAYNYYQMKELAKKLNFKKKTIIYFAGYFDSNYQTVFGPSMSTLYKRFGYNALSMEYYPFANINYPRAVRFLRPVAKHVAEMLAELSKEGLDPKKLELIGLSHGGQAIGFIGKHYREITGKNISRLTGLDPAGPCFRNLGPGDRIDASDADFVDIIHTNIDGFGMAPQLGHIDFYVNGGEYQIGDFQNIPCDNLCSHLKSYTFWVAALLNPGSFIGMLCDTIQQARERNCFDRKPFVTNVLGLNVDKTKRGIFYVAANSVFPYGMGQKGLLKENEVFRSLLNNDNKADVVQL